MWSALVGWAAGVAVTWSATSINLLPWYPVTVTVTSYPAGYPPGMLRLHLKDDATCTYEYPGITDSVVITGTGPVTFPGAPETIGDAYLCVTDMMYGDTSLLPGPSNRLRFSGGPGYEVDYSAGNMATTLRLFGPALPGPLTVAIFAVPTCLGSPEVWAGTTTLPAGAAAPGLVTWVITPPQVMFFYPCASADGGATYHQFGPASVFAQWLPYVLIDGFAAGVSPTAYFTPHMPDAAPAPAVRLATDATCATPVAGTAASTPWSPTLRITFAPPPSVAVSWRGATVCGTTDGLTWAPLRTKPPTPYVQRCFSPLQAAPYTCWCVMAAAAAAGGESMFCRPYYWEPWLTGATLTDPTPPMGPSDMAALDLMWGRRSFNNDLESAQIPGPDQCLTPPVTLEAVDWAACEAVWPGDAPCNVLWAGGAMPLSCSAKGVWTLPVLT